MLLILVLLKLLNLGSALDNETALKRKLYPAPPFGLENGKVSFGIEETGRYGGVGLQTGNSITVDCVNSNEVVGDVVAKHGYIDVLKVDIETLEHAPYACASGAYRSVVGRSQI
jgi:hypothetical protein